MAADLCNLSSLMEGDEETRRELAKRGGEMTLWQAPEGSFVDEELTDALRAIEELDVEQPTIHLEPGELDLEDSIVPTDSVQIEPPDQSLLAEFDEVHGDVVADVARSVDSGRVGILLDSLIMEREAIINLCRKHDGGYSFLPSAPDDESMDGMPFFFTISESEGETRLFLHFEKCQWELSAETSTIELSQAMFEVVNIAYGRFVLTEKVEAMCRLLGVI